MRNQGVAIPKSRLFDRFNPLRLGILSLRETTDNQLHRMSRTAKFESGSYPNYLFDAQILWIEGDRFVLTGFERIGTHNGDAEFAQSWLILTKDAPEMPEEKR